MEWIIKYIVGIFTVVVLEFDNGHWNLLLSNCKSGRSCRYSSHQISAHLDKIDNLKEGDIVYIKSYAECQKIKELEKFEDREIPKDGWICNAKTIEIRKIDE